jgi:hypothetical protein
MSSLSFMRFQLRVMANQRRHYHCIQHLPTYHPRQSSSGNIQREQKLSSSLSSHQRLFSSAQHQDHDEAAAAAANAAAIAKGGLPSTAFVGREDQKVEEQKRRRLSDVRVTVCVSVCVTTTATTTSFGAVCWIN